MGTGLVFYSTRCTLECKGHGKILYMYQKPRLKSLVHGGVYPRIVQCSMPTHKQSMVIWGFFRTSYTLPCSIWSLFLVCTCTSLLSQWMNDILLDWRSFLSILIETWSAQYTFLVVMRISQCIRYTFKPHPTVILLLFAGGCKNIHVHVRSYQMGFRA